MTNRIRHSTFSALALALGALLSAGVASAQDFEDPVSIAWKFGYGLSDSTYHAVWEDYKDQGYLPIQVEMDDGGAIYSGVWQKNTDDRGWASWRRLTSDQFHQNWDEYPSEGIPSDRSELRGHRRDVALFAGHGREQGRTRLDLEPQPHQRTVRHELRAEQGEVQADRHRRHRSGRHDVLFDHLARESSEHGMGRAARHDAQTSTGRNSTSIPTRVIASPTSSATSATAS